MRDEIIALVRRSWFWEPGLGLASITNVEKTNDQIDLRGGGSGCGGRVHEWSLGRPQQYRIAARPGHDDDQYRRRLCAGSERWRICHGALFVTALHAEYR
jgi:hypothetical protein